FPLVLKLAKSPEGPEEVILNVALSDLSATLRDLGPKQADFSLSLGSVSAVMEPLAPTPGKGKPAEISAVLAGADLSLNWQSNDISQDGVAKGDFNLGTLSFDLRLDLPGEKTKLTALADLSGVSAELDLFIPRSVMQQMAAGAGEKPE